VTPKKKRNKPMNTTRPTLARLAELGFTVEHVETYLPWARRRRDFCNFADVLAFKAGTPGVLAVQCTSRDNIAARVKKCLANASAREWLQAGNRIEVWGWFRVQEDRKKAWRASVRHIKVLPFEAHPALLGEADGGEESSAGDTKKILPAEGGAA
jgi:hypothetical protein